jgi:hypothetical protein
LVDHRDQEDLVVDVETCLVHDVVNSLPVQVQVLDPQEDGVTSYLHVDSFPFLLLDLGDHSSFVDH